MNDFWNDRYAIKEYAYGVNPNIYYKEQLIKLKPGKILFPAEGEGRNAVFAAKQGWKVTAFDSSLEGKRKAMMLASANDVKINYLIGDFESVSFPSEFFDCVVLVFAHMESFHRNHFHNKLASYLKPGGVLVLQGFSKEQVNYNSGGPRDVTMLFSKEELADDFKLFSRLEISDSVEILDEGPFHQGKAALLSLTGIK